MKVPHFLYMVISVYYQSSKAILDLLINQRLHFPLITVEIEYYYFKLLIFHKGKWKLKYRNTKYVYPSILAFCPLNTCLFLTGRPVELQFPQRRDVILLGQKDQALLILVYFQCGISHHSIFSWLCTYFYTSVVSILPIQSKLLSFWREWFEYQCK